MDHQYIKEYNLADRYLLGKLGTEEQSRFEEHFIDCQECLEELERTEEFRLALKSVVVEEAARSRAYLQAGLLAHLARLSRGRQAGLLLGAILLVMALPTAFFITEMRRVRGELEQVKMAATDYQREAAEKQEEARGLEKEMEEAQRRLADQRHQMETQLEGERQARAGLAQELQRMRRSQVSVPVFVLNTVRSAELGPSAPVNQITITPASPWIVLSLELEADPEIRSYRASLLNAEKRLIWRGVNLKPSPKDGLAVSINASLLKAGDYLVSLEGRTQSGRYLSVAKYPLRVIKKSSDK